VTEIVGIAAAQAALQPLLANVRDAVTAAGGLAPTARDAAVDAQKARLKAFRSSTRAADLTNVPEVAAVAAVDKIALDLELALGQQQIEQDLQLLEQGAERLRQLTSSLDAQTSRNQASAGSIGLKPVKQTLDAMSELVESVKQVRTTLDGSKPDEAAVAAQIEDFVEKFTALKQAVRNV